MSFVDKENNSRNRTRIFNKKGLLNKVKTFIDNVNNIYTQEVLGVSFARVLIRGLQFARQPKLCTDHANHANHAM